MGEINYNFNLLFRDEKRAESLFIEMKHQEDVSEHELVTLINICCNSDIETYGYAFDIEEIQRFRNEVQIPCYTGRSSEMPQEIAGPLFAFGAEIVRMSVLYEDAPDWDSIYFVDGKKTSKKNYDKEFKKFKIEDTTDKLQRLLSSNRFSQASKIAHEAELDRILPEEGYLFDLMESHMHDDLAILLMQAGKYDKSCGHYYSSWLETAAGCGSTILLRAFLDYGMDPYHCGEAGTSTALHAVLYQSEPNWLAKLQLLIDHCRDNLSPVTNEGSPLWFGFGESMNVAACVVLQSAGGTVIPPKGYYDNFNRLMTVIEAIKHGDVVTAKEEYQLEDYLDALYWALRHQNFDIVQWIDAKQSIDWCTSVGNNLSTDDSLKEIYTTIPLYEIAFYLNDGPNCDPRLLDYIIDSVPADKSIYNRLLVYVAGLNDLPEAKELLQKLIDLDADIDAHVNINGDLDVTCAVNHAMLHECLDIVEILLEAGVKTGKEYLPDAEPLSGWLNGWEGDLKRKGKLLFKKYSVS
jgi:hypothetical protein